MTPSPLSRLTDAQSTRRQLLAMATVGGVGAAGVAASGAARSRGRAAASPTTSSRCSARRTCTATSTTGTTSRTPSTTTARTTTSASRRWPALINGDPRRASAPATIADPRRRRHDPGHAAGVLLRQDRADHRGRDAPDGAGDERRSTTTPRRSATTSSTTASPLLRTFESQLRLPAPRRQRGRPDDRRAGLPAVRHQDGQARPRPPPLRVGILGLTNPGVAIWDKANVEGKMKFPGLVEQAKNSCRSSRRPAATSWSSPPTRRRHVVVLRRRAAVPGERRAPCWPSRCRASTRSSSATPTSRSPSSSSPTSRPASRCCCRAALLGHARRA